MSMGFNGLYELETIEPGGTFTMSYPVTVSKIAGLGGLLPLITFAVNTSGTG